MALTAKQQVFVEEYLVTWNASEAARRAEYANPGQQGHRLLKNVEISTEIARRVADKAMTADEVLVRLAEQARAEYSAYLRHGGTVDLGAMIQDGMGHLIKGIKETAHGKTIEFYDAQSALVHIGRHHGLFERGGEENPIHTVNQTLEEWKQLQAERQRQAAETMAIFDDGDEDDDVAAQD